MGAYFNEMWLRPFALWLGCGGRGYLAPTCTNLTMIFGYPIHFIWPAMTLVYGIRIVLRALPYPPKKH